MLLSTATLKKLEKREADAEEFTVCDKSEFLLEHFPKPLGTDNSPVPFIVIPLVTSKEYMVEVSKENFWEIAPNYPTGDDT